MIKKQLENNENVKPNTKLLNQLKENFPDFFDKDNNFMLDKFKNVLKSDEINITKEGYELNFLGKSYARFQTSTETETIISPLTDHNNDDENKDSENLYIIGDNLDALKHLLKSYSRKVKCIYIDPPYNTGSDGFVYPDNFKFDSTTLSNKMGIDEEEAERIIDMRGKSTHSAWLTFMYPRLILARELLSDDEVIFISIDDNEQANLKLICDEIFGEENFISTLKWKKKRQPSFLSTVANIMEYVLVYSKSRININKLAIDSLSDDDKPIVNASNNYSEITLPKGIRVKANVSKIKAGVYKNKTMDTEYLDDVLIENNRTINTIKIKAKFRTTQEEINRFCKDDLIFITSNLGLRRNLTIEETNSKKSITDLLLDWGQNQDATEETRLLFGIRNDTNIFDNPKPTLLIKNLVKSCNNNSVVLDFFSGSATTAHAVMKLNAEDGGNRKYILVQLPEKIEESKTAFKEGYKTIDEIGRERIKRAAQKIKEETNADIDYGFKVVKLENVQENTIDKLESFNPNVLVSDDYVNDFTNENSSGLETILTTWLNQDGYGLHATWENFKLVNYIAHHYSNSLYIVNEGIESSDISRLIEMIENNELNISRIVIYTYSLPFTIINELKTNIKNLRNNKTVDIIERY
ncbi:site-specific DNA-methyltransferase [uncultured Gemella sp.]|uniref:site-specific DNA-methyltransferase n=1 Tax=uncultured Gemella sp. TaxID=254352 RepID=UPI0025F7800F|nr:site-specific DNA-methyltransferase [uncultured Gemella sp.]